MKYKCTDLIALSVDCLFYCSDLLVLSVDCLFYCSDLLVLSADCLFYCSDLLVLSADCLFYCSDLLVLSADCLFYLTNKTQDKSLNHRLYQLDFSMILQVQIFFVLLFVEICNICCGLGFLLSIQIQLLYQHKLINNKWLRLRIYDNT